MIFKTFWENVKKKQEEDLDEMDEIWRKKKKMNEDDIEELIGVIVPAAVALCQVKERKKRTKSKYEINHGELKDIIIGMIVNL